MKNTMTLTKDEQYAIAAIANLFDGKKPEVGRTMILLDDCAVTPAHAKLISALARRCQGTFDADAMPMTEDEL